MAAIFDLSPLTRTNSAVVFIVAFVASVLLTAKGEIRCYCNLPVCVSTGYMCKSAKNTCFTEHFAFSSDLSQSRHGCSELLRTNNARDANQGSPCSRLTRRGGSNDVLPDQTNHGLREQTRDSTGHGDIFPSLFCCQEDMCNYVNAMDIHVQVQAKSNHTSHRSGVTYNGEKGGYPFGGPGSEPTFFANHDLWFKAAVIAVPIAGSFVLVLLILLAARMLKRDSERQRRLSELRRQRQFQARLLLGETYSTEKGDQNNFHFSGHYSEIGAEAYATDYLVSAPDKKGEPNYHHDFVYERPVSVSLCGSFLPLTKWDSNYKSPAFV